MELKIDIDTSQIDYAKINEAILSKIDDNFIRKLITTSYSSNETIESEVKDILTTEIAQYLSDGNCKWISNPNIESKTKHLSNEYLTERVKEMVQKVLNDIGQDNIEKIIVDMLPTIVWKFVFDRFTNNAYEMQTMTIERARADIFNILRGRGYPNI